MSYNTLWQEVASYQDDKETTINNQRGRLDAALTEKYEIVGDLSPTLTAEEFRALIVINTDGTQTAAQTVTVPSTVKKVFAVYNDSSYNLTVIEGTRNYILLPGARATFYNAGAADSLKRIVTISNAPDVIACRPLFESAATTSKTVYLRVMEKAQTLLSVANGLVAYASVLTEPDGTTDFDIRKNGVQVGTIEILSGASTGTFTVGSDVSFVAGDRLSIVTTTSNAVGKNYAMTIQLTV